MNEFPKVVVVDDGQRAIDHAISAELAELGYASVTASLDAADDVLELIPSPTAVFLQIPHDCGAPRRQRFLDLAKRLKTRRALSGVPVIVVDPQDGAKAGGFGAMLESRFAVAVRKPER